VELYESYLVVEQSWILHTDQECTVNLDAWGGLEFPLPEDAEGIYLVHPEEPEAMAGEGRVLLSGTVGPLGADPSDWTPSLTYRFSIPSEEQIHGYSQLMPVAVEEALVILPVHQEQTRYPVLEVGLWVPHCGGISDGREYVCFADDDGRSAAQEPLNWIERRVARSGRGEPGARLVFETRGWPVPDRKGRWIIGIMAALVLVWGVSWLIRERRGVRTQDGRARPSGDVLLSRRTALLTQLVTLRQTTPGEERERSRQLIRELGLMLELERIYGRMAEAGQPGLSPGPSQPGGDEGE
jgi:hypothetical protein